MSDAHDLLNHWSKESVFFFRRCLALAVTLVEALHTTTGVDELLLPSEKRMALVAQFNVEISTAGAAGRERVATRALHVGIGVFGMGLSLHGFSSDKA